MDKEEKNILLTLPNILSLLRIFLVPFFLIMILQQKVFEAFIVFLFAGFTDLLDGFAARLWHQKTKIGAYLDPAADKLLMTASFIILTFPALNSPNIIPLWLTIAVISRDLLIVSGASLLYKLRGQKSFPPSILGKASTVCQVTVILFVLYSNSFQITSPYINFFYLITLAFTLLSAAHYSFIGYKIISPPKQE